MRVKRAKKRPHRSEALSRRSIVYLHYDGHCLQGRDLEAVRPFDPRAQRVAVAGAVVMDARVAPEAPPLRLTRYLTRAT